MTRLGEEGGRNLVIRQILRNDASILDGLALAGVSTVHEAQGRTGYLGPDIRPIQQGLAVAGNAVTVLCPPGDNMMIHAAVEVCSDNDVLIVGTTGPSPYGLVGDLLATSLRAHGVIGLVIDAGVRDVSELRALGFPVWTRHISSAGAVKESPGSVNISIEIEGVAIDPGDVVIADDDGVVVVTHDRADEVLSAARARLDNEEVKRRRLSAGELSVDIDGLRQKLTDLGVEYIDSLDET